MGYLMISEPFLFEPLSVSTYSFPKSFSLFEYLFIYLRKQNLKKRVTKFFKVIVVGFLVVMMLIGWCPLGSRE